MGWMVASVDKVNSILTDFNRIFRYNARILAEDGLMRTIGALLLNAELSR